MHDARSAFTPDADQTLDAQDAVATGGEQNVDRLSELGPDKKGSSKRNTKAWTRAS